MNTRLQGDFARQSWSACGVVCVSIDQQSVMQTNDGFALGR